MSVRRFEPRAGHTQAAGLWQYFPDTPYALHTIKGALSYSISVPLQLLSFECRGEQKLNDSALDTLDPSIWSSNAHQSNCNCNLNPHK